MSALFEKVYTVQAYYDGPRAGVASFRGRPHWYNSQFLDVKDDYEDDDVFELRTLDDETFRLALEDWELWRRWERAFQAGETNLETHPALPGDRARHDAIALEKRVAALVAPVVRAKAEFRSLDERDGDEGKRIEVRWTQVD